MSEEVLRSYLSRSMTLMYPLTSPGNLDDNIRLMTNCGVKFAGRALYLLTQAFGGARTLSIRRGHWKYLDHRGYDKGEMAPYALTDTAPEAPGQLYNLESDPGEKTNLFFKRPEIVAQLKALLDSSKLTGRSAPQASNAPKP